MDVLYHIIGLCPDSNTHFDLLDIVTLFGNDLLVQLKYIKLKIKSIIL